MNYNERKAFLEAFPYSLPIMATYILMGCVFGIMMANAGYSAWISLIMSIIIYAGAMQYIAVAWLAGGIPLISIAIISLSVNARQFFYAIANLKRYKIGGFRKWYLIFSVTDETFAILNLREQKTQNIQDELYNQKVMFYISLLNHIYWITGCVSGTLLGNSIEFIKEIHGLDFIVIATFCILLYENLKFKNNLIPILVGVFSTFICFMIDKKNFLSYSLILIIFILLILQNYINKQKT